MYRTIRSLPCYLIGMLALENIFINVVLTDEEFKRCTDVYSRKSRIRKWDCEDLHYYNVSGPALEDCLEVFLYFRYTPAKPKEKQAYTNLRNIYCNGNSQSEQCNSCLDEVFDKYFHHDICLYTRNDSLIAIHECLKQFPNSKFGWSRDVILNNGQKHITLSDTPFDSCKGVMIDGEGHEISEITFPVYVKMASKLMDQTLTTMLALFLNALEIESSPVTCQNIKDIGFLKNYKINPKIVEPKPRSLEAYANLRRHMCSPSEDPQHCIDCFQKPDERFLYHLYNKDEKESSFGASFTDIKTSLSQCVEKFELNAAYKDLKSLNYWGPQSNLSSVIICKRGKNFGYLEKLSEISSKILSVGSSQSVIDAVFMNYLAFKMYQVSFLKAFGIAIAILKTVPDEICDDIYDSFTQCAAARTSGAVKAYHERTYAFGQSEDRQLGLLSDRIVKCVEPNS